MQTAGYNIKINMEMNYMVEIKVIDYLGNEHIGMWNEKHMCLKYLLIIKEYMWTIQRFI